MLTNWTRVTAVQATKPALTIGTIYWRTELCTAQIGIDKTKRHKIHKSLEFINICLNSNLQFESVPTKRNSCAVACKMKMLPIMVVGGEG